MRDELPVNPAPAHEAFGAARDYLSGASDNTLPWQPLALALGLLLLAAGLYQLIRYLRQPSTRRALKRSVFTALADELGLSIRQQWLLVRIAHQQDLPSALVMLLSADTFTHHTRRYVQKLPPKAGEVTQHQLDAIRRTVFQPA